MIHMHIIIFLVGSSLLITIIPESYRSVCILYCIYNICCWNLSILVWFCRIFFFIKTLVECVIHQGFTHRYLNLFFSEFLCTSNLFMMVRVHCGVLGTGACICDIWIYLLTVLKFDTWGIRNQSSPGITSSEQPLIVTHTL